MLISLSGAGGRSEGRSKLFSGGLRAAPRALTTTAENPSRGPSGSSLRAARARCDPEPPAKDCASGESSKRPSSENLCSSLVSLQRRVTTTSAKGQCVLNNNDGNSRHNYKTETVVAAAEQLGDK